jgi:glucose/arabinose dehydrogenase
MKRSLYCDAIAISLVASLAACSQPANGPDPGVGTEPKLPPPQATLLPTVKVASAKGWPEDVKPIAANGLAVSAFARGLDHPRWLYTLPNGDVLVAETNAPSRPDNDKGIRAFFMKTLMGRAGAAVPSANRITLLRDTGGNGVANTRTVFISGLNSPFGMALVGEWLYVANTDAVLRFPYRDGATEITTPGEKVADLPAGSINHHWTKNLIASRDGKHLYATVGSNSNVGENGIEQEERRAAILAIELATGRSQILASGLRNPNGLSWEPQSGALWTVVNERDELGNNLVPDYLTSVREGAFYGWPFSYYGQNVDTRVKAQRPDLVAAAIRPDYALGSHVAALGLVFYDGKLLPPRFTGGAFIGEHGSWNRTPPAGYKVVFVRFENGRPSGMPEDVLTGFLNADGEALGRPVGVAIDRAGALLVADDVGNVVWRVTPAATASASR